MVCNSLENGRMWQVAGTVQTQVAATPWESVLQCLGQVRQLDVRLGLQGRIHARQHASVGWRQQPER